MRNLKKFLALVLAMMMAFSLMTTVSASSFKDDDDITSKYAEAVNVLTELGVINGYEAEDGTTTFNPKGSITRAEVAAIIYRIVTGDVDDDNVHLYKGYKEFSDVDSDKWYAGYVNYCANNGLVKGVGGDRFAPSSNVTGYEALVMILRAMGYNNPNEFSSGDWKMKASGYGSKLEITTNIASGSLGVPATREMVAEIMYKAIQAPMVNYSPLTLYTTDLLVDASEVNAQYGANDDPTKKLYAEDVPNTLLYNTFKIVGKRTNDNYGQDDYGRPVIEWVKDLDTDTVANGGKYVPNFQTAMAGADSAADETAGGLTPGAKYATNDSRTGDDVVPAKGSEPTALAVTMAAKKIYKGTVVTECQFTKDVNADKPIPFANIDEYLNGGKVEDRSKNLDINHTQEGTIGAPGRTTEVYNYTRKQADGTTKSLWDIVYVDTFLGVVTDVTKRTFDTAGNHVMQDATLTVKVNDAVTVTDSKKTSDFNYNVGDLVLMTTYGFSDATQTVTVANLQTSIPVVENDFKGDDTTAGDNAGGWAVDTVGKPTTANITVKGTLGTKNHKTGIETATGNYMANVVYMASKNVNDGDPVTGTGVDYYKDNDGTPAKIAATDTTVPSTSPYNYGHRMINAAINKDYTVVLDENGFVVGMTAVESTADIGVVVSMEPVRIGTGKWAIETELFMIDGTTKTVRLVDQDSHTDGTADEDFKFFGGSNDAETSIGKDDHNLAAKPGVLVKIEAFNMEGATYHMVTATNKGEWSNFDAAVAADNDDVVTGEAETLNAAEPTTYNARPSNVDPADGTTAVNENIDDNTKFIIAEVNWDYSLNTGNVGGYSDMDYAIYTGFKTIPTIEGGTGHVLYQRIGNNVFVHPDDTKLADRTLEYTIKNQPKVPDVEAYLVYATGTTYAEYSTYKALVNGVPKDLKVSNNNLSLVNKDIETAMAKTSAVLVVVESTNTKGYATAVDILTLAGQKLPAAATVYFDKNGVLAYDTDGSKDDGTEIDGFLTVDKDCVVKIVNLKTGNYYDATQDSIKQYETYGDSHDFIYDLNEYGYIDTIYIID